MRSLLLLIAFLMPFALMQAQSDDEIIYSTDDLRFSENLSHPLGGSASGLKTAYESDCSRFFLEATAIMSFDANSGMGLHFAYLPKHFGGYGSLHFIDHSVMGTFGMALRPVIHTSFLDWQLFTGMAISNGVGFEAGMRFSASAEANNGAFSWLSASLSRIYLNDNIYYALGLSIDISLMCIFIFF